MDTTSAAGSGVGSGDVCPCSTVAASTASNEQPQTKRQKIEQQIKVGSKAMPPQPPDILDLDANSNSHLCSSLSSSSTHSLSTPSSANNSPTTTPSSSRAASYAQLLHNILPQNGDTEPHSQPQSAQDEVDRAAKLPDLLSLSTTNSNSSHLSSRSNCIPTTAATSIDDMLEFEQSLTRQCLCGVSERTLRKPFQSHYSQDTNGQKRIAYLREWPTNKLLQFLSNLQLLFDIYLKQNAKGFICTRIMDVCDALIRNDHKLIDEIIVLAGYDNSYVQFLAGRVLAAFLVIAKQELNDEWLQKIVDQLFNFEQLDQAAVQKIHFSLDIIKRIVEWKDMEIHPLDDDWMAAMPTEFALYKLLRTWMFLCLHPDYDPKDRVQRADAVGAQELLVNAGVETHSGDVIQWAYFTRGTKERSFLATPEGQPYVKVFQKLRTQYLTIQYINLKIIFNDNIIPKEWLYRHIHNHWDALLRIDHGQEDS